MRRRYLVPPIASSEITPERVYFNRRKFMHAAGLVAVPALASLSLRTESLSLHTESAIVPDTRALQFSKASSKPDGFLTDDQQTPFSDITSYGNFYEFGTEKIDPGNFAHEMTIDPWSLQVDGEVHKSGKLHLEDILSTFALQERIYRLRCVEGWSMVIPWVGIPLADFLQRFEPTGGAKYVAFETLFRPEEMRGTRSFTSIIDWPYREGLRIDEAMHPLTLLAVGLYGKTLPNQNGAPIRLVVPWKYGFKSIKSIVRIHLQDTQPVTTWQALAPEEYGFYANVNPAVDHPRWSQASERRLPSTLFRPNRIPTQLFNGYAKQVAHLYQGMDLARNY